MRTLGLFVLILSVTICANAVVGIGSCTTIQRSGSYVLTTNIKAFQSQLRGPGQACIWITANFVTLDLGGFTITGPDKGIGKGIYSSYGNGTIATRIVNGAVTNFDRGIALEGAAHSVENVRVTGNGVGVSVDGTGIAVSDVQAWGNDYGIVCFGGTGHSVLHSTATGNNLVGIYLNWCSGSRIIGNTAVSNGSFGVLITCPAVVTQNMASQNSSGDIVTDAPSPACTLSDNNPAP